MCIGRSILGIYSRLNMEIWNIAVVFTYIHHIKAQLWCLDLYTRQSCWLFVCARNGNHACWWKFQRLFYNKIPVVIYPFIAKMKLPVFLSLVFCLWVMEIQKFAKSVLHRKTKTEDLRRTGSWKPSKKSTLRFLSRTRSEPEREDVGIEEEETESWVATLPDLPPMRPRKSPLIMQTRVVPVGP